MRMIILAAALLMVYTTTAQDNSCCNSDLYNEMPFTASITNSTDDHQNIPATITIRPATGEYYIIDYITCTTPVAAWFALSSELSTTSGSKRITWYIDNQNRRLNFMIAPGEKLIINRILKDEPLQLQVSGRIYRPK